MVNRRIAAPSVLSLDYTDTRGQMALLEQSGAEWIHFDVMDGSFVPNLTFGPDILKAFKKGTSLYADVHLMIDDPRKYAPVFIAAGADGITFHTESLDNDPERIRETIALIKSLGAAAGITVKPGTDITQFADLLPELDLVLVMSVEPGFGGQSFMEDQLDKVRWLAERREALGLSFRIEIDGGINGSTWKKAVEAGADTLVAGSWLFSGNMKEKIGEMLA